MKKIGLITLHHNNFGSILQCYSSKKYIESLGYECVVFDLDDKVYNFKSRLITLFRLLQRIFNQKNALTEFLEMRKSIQIEKEYLSEGTKIQMEQFVQMELKPIHANMDKLKKIGRDDRYVAFITGSDQVWNASRNISPFFFLNFVPIEKRIALAPSFGISEIPRFNKKIIKRYLETFSNLSVREESGKKIIYELIGKDVLRLFDPTILLKREEWARFSKFEQKSEKYILVHFLNEPNAVALKFIQSVADEENRRLIVFGYKYQVLMNIKNVLFFDGSPEDYVNAIYGAELVLTDSYHSTLFSINLGTDFLTFDRKHLHKYTQKTRIIDLLTSTQLLDRFITQTMSIHDICNLSRWDAETVFLEEREKLECYIKESINYNNRVN